MFDLEGSGNGEQGTGSRESVRGDSTEAISNEEFGSHGNSTGYISCKVSESQRGNAGTDADEC